MTGLTDELLRRRLSERASAGSAPALGTIARSVAASPRRRVSAGSARWPILGSAAACSIVAVALVVGLLNRTVSPAVAPSLGDMQSIAPTSSAAAPAGSIVPVTPAAAAWTSIGWTPVSAKPFEVTKRTVVTDAVALGDGFVAVGYTPDDKPVVGHIWKSLDGQAWIRIDGGWLVGLIPDHLLTIGDRLVLLARRDGPGDLDPTELWISDDGANWTQGPSPAGSTGYSRGVAGGADGLLVRFGGQTFRIGADLHAWTLTTDTWPADVAIGQPTDGDGFWIQPGATGMGEAGTVRTGAIWTSSDGVTWSPASLADPGGAVNEIYRVDGGWVAVGSALTFGCRLCYGPIDLTRITWFSADGRAWTRVPRAGSSAANRWFGASFIGDGHRLIAIRPAAVQVIGGTDPPTVEMFQTVNGTTWTPMETLPAAPRPELSSGVSVGRHGLVELPGGVIDESSPAAWWGQAVEAPPTAGPTTSPAPSGSASDALPITGCDALGFSPIRCRAIVTRAEHGMNPPLTDADVVSATVMAPRDNRTSLGSVDIADVLFAFADKGAVDIPVGCMFSFGFASSDRACSDDPQIQVAGGVSRDIPCGPTPGDDTHPCGPLPPDPAPATIAASRPLTLPTFIVPIDHRGHYEIPVGTATIPNGAISEISADVGDPRPAGFWIDPYIQVEVRPDRGGPPIDSYYGRRLKGQLPVHVYLVFDVTDLVDPGSILEIRNLVVR